MRGLPTRPGGNDQETEDGRRMLRRIPPLHKTQRRATRPDITKSSQYRQVLVQGVGL